VVLNTDQRLRAELIMLNGVLVAAYARHRSQSVEDGVSILACGSGWAERRVRLCVRRPERREWLGGGRLVCSPV
jgi:hypothetical protein